MHDGGLVIVEVVAAIVELGTAFVRLTGTVEEVVALLLVELRAARAVIPTAARATMATITTIIHPLSSGDFFSTSLKPSAIEVSLFSTPVSVES